ncbi:hypothetical protein CEQ90_14065 [Lewinellaceae bacterium SD302]|nr:hypothetical protein CEQ90_14065 [Lewinellaceae bacterium SD302]
MPTRIIPFLAVVLTFAACTGDPPPPESDTDAMTGPERQAMSFEQRQIIDSARWWWALTVGDVTGDGLQDVVAINDNANGGYLAYYTGTVKDTIWAETVIAQNTPDGEDFAAGDLEAGDMDGDGDIDVLAVQHTGEWNDAGAPAKIYWYENTGGDGWIDHFIGHAPDAVKDLSIADFDGDDRMDVSVLIFDEGNISVHRQTEDGSFDRVLNLNYPNLHKGMDVGDFDGDGDLDLLANGNIFSNPGGDLRGNWTATKISERWNNQTGDWSRNATKGWAADIDEDGTDEVFITHSERAGYPLAMYRNDGQGNWTETIVADSIPAAHTLQVFDMDLDGDLDIVTGVNIHRAVNLGKEDDQVFVFINQGDYKNWTRQTITTGGIYNGRVADFEGDGDYDIFRYPGHESRDLFLLTNQTR